MAFRVYMYYNPPVELCVRITEKEDIALFKELVQRATNLWPDAPPAIKEFADVITSGNALQDYYAQAGVARSDRDRPVTVFVESEAEKPAQPTGEKS